MFHGAPRPICLLSTVTAYGVTLTPNHLRKHHPLRQALLERHEIHKLNPSPAYCQLKSFGGCLDKRVGVGWDARLRDSASVNRVKAGVHLVVDLRVVCCERSCSGSTWSTRAVASLFPPQFSVSAPLAASAHLGGRRFQYYGVRSTTMSESPRYLDTDA